MPKAVSHFAQGLDNEEEGREGGACFCLAKLELMAPT